MAEAPPGAVPTQVTGAEAEPTVAEVGLAALAEKNAEPSPNVNASRIKRRADPERDLVFEKSDFVILVGGGGGIICETLPI